jgi:hypothetical protein
MWRHFSFPMLTILVYIPSLILIDVFAPQYTTGFIFELCFYCTCVSVRTI